jgi:CheY-like chemotaxis protein
MTGDREQCFAAGIDGYASKPLHATELYALIDQLAGNGGRHSHRVTPARAGSAIPQPNAVDVGPGYGSVSRLVAPLQSAPLQRPPRNLKCASQRIRGPSSGHGRPQLTAPCTMRLETLAAVIQMPEGSSGYNAAKAGSSHA